MNFSWQYPIFLSPHESGYASVAVKGRDDQALIVHTDQEAAAEFMQSNGLPGSPRPLENDREFAWMLRGLRDPVRQVAFDPQLGDESYSSRWETSVAELLEQRLKPDYSPWNYPVYVVALDEGFVCIRGLPREADETGDPVTAIGVFTEETHAERYLAASEQEGTPCELKTMNEARWFLAGLETEIEAVALNPARIDDNHTALRCFQISTLLEKYLVDESPEREALEDAEKKDGKSIDGEGERPIE